MTRPRYHALVDHDAAEALAALEDVDGLVRFFHSFERVRDEVVSGMTSATRSAAAAAKAPAFVEKLVSSQVRPLNQ